MWYAIAAITPQEAENLRSLGIGGIFAAVIIKMVLDFLVKRKAAPPTVDMLEMSRIVHKIKSEVSDLYAWHNKDDGSGAKIWYVNPSLQATIEKLAVNIEAQTQMFREIMEGQRDMKRDIETLSKG